jgi:hypothetical protein
VALHTRPRRDYDTDGGLTRISGLVAQLALVPATGLFATEDPNDDVEYPQ